ncbi:unnamed protein product [Bemisia tabaci]|uniref:Uncharacterized protein n=1 Tax=Bemisia tabaci TaxID=7038 RepID=A0A9P0ABP9_BEMTA|nr:unnamed protein product [Bemisia tabaci]
MGANGLDPVVAEVIKRGTSMMNVVTKFIRIGIADKNDNPPYFDKELYEAEVDENEDIQHTVLTVTAKDHDEYICFDLSWGRFVRRSLKFVFKICFIFRCSLDMKNTLVSFLEAFRTRVHLLSVD